MYHGFYENSTLPATDSLDCDCIRKNVYMYLCGASVDCRSMMTFATSAMDQITSALTDIMPAVSKEPGLYRLYIPLRQALELLHSQGNRPNMFPMRVAVARLVDVTMLYLMANKGFMSMFEQQWAKEIYPMSFWDSVLFRRMRLVGEPDEEAVVDDESDEGTVVGDVERGEVEEEDDDATPRAEKKQKDAEARGESGAEQEGERQRGSEETGSQMDTPSRHRNATEESSAESADRTESQTTERAMEPQPEVWCLSISKY
ncbi:hypothetical protein CONLIGDRAFT_626430 [Coniochaeta ligniaria NRRL 30616]|uniref:Uncharacterized protein n=1 Tax=Coniochaeta ligniaria NRRL 30616 TaxID=1408157 RepID=A0A1J7J4X4_9PEZI|nr:hypothetical protein CONLIGDRAFT_626430 [Coniochaeta ligniaria NRRL 30616]